jgi:hypothetical protein
MARRRRPKCKCCRRLFVPDPRNLRHQCYCSQPLCRAASKAASQDRWLARPQNQDYFRGPDHVARVKDWRARHPGYWRKASRPPTAFKDVSIAQVLGSKGKTGDFARSPLQDLLTTLPAVRKREWKLNRLFRGDTATTGHRPHHRPCYASAKTFLAMSERPGPSAALTAEAVVIDYETFVKIHDSRDRQGLTAARSLARSASARPLPSGSRVHVSLPATLPAALNILDPFSRASSDCSMHILTALSRSSSACARRDTAAA